MGIDKIINLAVALVLAVAVTGHLPQITLAVRKAQVQLLHESQASRWGSPDLLYKRHNGFAAIKVLKKCVVKPSLIRTECIHRLACKF